MYARMHACVFNVLQYVTVCCSVLLLHPSAILYAAPHCTTLQHTATHCNTLQHRPRRTKARRPAGTSSCVAKNRVVSSNRTSLADMCGCGALPPFPPLTPPSSPPSSPAMSASCPTSHGMPRGVTETVSTSGTVAVCCSVLQCVAVCCSVLQCVAVCCSVLHCNAGSCSE